MRSEDRACRAGFERRAKVDSLLHDAANALEYEKRRMPLVDMPDRRLDPHGGKRAHSADAEHDLLLDSSRAVAAVETMRDVAVVFGVLLEIGIEEIQHHVAYTRLPDLYRDAVAA